MKGSILGKHREKSRGEIDPETSKNTYEIFKKRMSGGLHFGGSGAPFWCLFGGSGSSGGLPGATREPPGGVLGVLGPPGVSRAPPGSLLGASLGPPGGLLGASRGSLGPSRRPKTAPRWPQDGPRCPQEGLLGASWGLLGDQRRHSIWRVVYCSIFNAFCF